MANYYFQRDTKVFIHVPTTAAGTPAMFYELPVLDGYSFSQATNTSEITLNQAQTTGGVSLRARQMFNDSYAPAEWSFSTYMSPFISAGGTKGAAGKAAASALQCEVSEAMWAMFFSQTVDGGLTPHADQLAVLPGNSNSATVGKFDLYFVLGGATVDTAYTYTSTEDDSAGAGKEMIYKIADCSVNELSFDFDIDGLAVVNWSGQGKIITDHGDTGLTVTSTSIYEGVSNTTGFIRNRVSDITINPADTTLSGDSNNYVATLTGGNITMGNNLTFLTPETLGVVNQPLGHVTGTRNIGGNFTCYLDNIAHGSASLFEDLIENTTDIQNSVSLQFDIGASAAPFLMLTLPTCHLEVPTHSIDDVISLETNFHALPATIDGTNEVTQFEFTGKAIG